MLQFGLVLPLLLLEAAIRLFGPIMPGNYSTGTFLTPHPVFGRYHVPGFNGWLKTREFTTRVRINAAGLRGPERPYAKPPGTRRILVVGDSFVEAAQVQEPEAVVGRLEAAVAAEAVVAPSRPLPSLDRLRRAVAPVGVAALGQPLRRLEVRGAALGLVDDLLVPLQPEPPQAVEDALEPVVLAADRVGVLVPEQEATALAAREEPVEECGAGAADVERAGRRRAEARPGRHGSDDTSQ